MGASSEVEQGVPARLSTLGGLYERAYAAVAGVSPMVRPWHHQWLASVYLRRDLSGLLAGAQGRLLDVGCGAKPYRRHARAVSAYVGIDVLPGPEVDHVITPSGRWPLADAEFDIVLCTQVLEHAVSVEHVLSECRRVLRPGGVLLCSVPFIYNEHGSPFDFRRFSMRAAGVFEAAGFEVREVRRQGAVGSTIGVLLHNWVELTLNGGPVRRLLKGVLLPVRLPVSLVVNLLGVAVDALDRTAAFYGNVLFILKRA